VNVLFVTSRFPYPLLRGDQVVQFHRLRTLSERHSITLLSFYEHESELEGLPFVKQYCKKMILIKHTKIQSLFGIAKNLFSSKPLQVAYYESKVFRDKLLRLIENESIDIVHVFLLRISPYFFDIHKPKIIELVDSMVLNFSRRVMQSSTFNKALLKEELRRLVDFEHSISKYFDELVVVSDMDKSSISAKNIHAIPLGIDLEKFYPEHSGKKTPRIVFSGNMSYAPNIEAISWFIENCWINIHQAIPDAECWIVGSNPSSQVKKLANKPNVCVLGHVASVADIIRTASIAVAPMQSGSGMQFKILEAMACGIPVVTTALGLGGIKALHGKHILVADEPQGFVEMVLRLIQDDAQAKEIGKSGYDFIQLNHSWESAALAIENLYSSALSKFNNS
jgi:polysaccharide biosynthesis protein PslH